MRLELQNMGTNEQGMVLKVREIDSENQKLLAEASALREESEFYKDKSRKLEIQLNQSVASERVLNENLVALENRNRKFENDLLMLEQKGTQEYEVLARESENLQSRLVELASREQVLQGQLQSAETENKRLMNEIRTVQQREFDYSRQISNLNQTNNQLLRKIEAAQLLNNRLRNDIIGVIDNNGETNNF
jgi:chromosome segregation ATPase